MAKARTTLTVEEEVLRAAKIRAARSGRGESEVIEEALRKDLGLDLLDRLWAGTEMDAESAMEMALEAQHATRDR